MDRREFLTKAAMAAALLGVSVSVTSCGDDEPAGPAANTGDVTGTATGSGHTHSGIITKAQLTAGAAVTVTFSGSGHSHDLDLLDAEVQEIAQGMQVRKANFVIPGDPNAHPHTYTFN